MISGHAGPQEAAASSFSPHSVWARVSPESQHLSQDTRGSQLSFTEPDKSLMPTPAHEVAVTQGCLQSRAVLVTLVICLTHPEEEGTLNWRTAWTRMPWVNVRGHFLLANWCRRDKPTVGGPIPGQVGLGWYLTQARQHVFNPSREISVSSRPSWSKFQESQSYRVRLSVKK